MACVAGDEFSIPTAKADMLVILSSPFVAITVLDLPPDACFEEDATSPTLFINFVLSLAGGDTEGSQSYVLDISVPD